MIYSCLNQRFLTAFCWLVLIYIIYLFIYFRLYWVFIALHGLVASRGYSVAIHGLFIVVSCGAQTQGRTGFSGCSMWA